MKNLKKSNTNYWKNGVIGLGLIMSGMWVGTANTGHELKELKVSINQQASGETHQGKVKGQ